MRVLGPLWSMEPQQQDNCPPPFCSSASVQFNCSPWKSHWILSHYQLVDSHSPTKFFSTKTGITGNSQGKRLQKPRIPNKTCICDPATPLEGTPKGNLKSARHRDTGTHTFTAVPFPTDGYRTSLGPVNR